MSIYFYPTLNTRRSWTPGEESTFKTTINAVTEPGSNSHLIPPDKAFTLFLNLYRAGFNVSRVYPGTDNAPHLVFFDVRPDGEPRI
jgi:hypothetical protein